MRGAAGTAIEPVTASSPSSSATSPSSPGTATGGVPCLPMRFFARADLLARISIDPQVCGGKPCIKGTRIWVSLILDLLAGGSSEEDVRAEYPQLTHDDILAAIAYGAERAREQIVPVPAV